MDGVLVAALQGWFAKVTLDTGQSQLHHPAPPTGKLGSAIEFQSIVDVSLIFLKIAKVAADQPAHASDEQEKLAAHLRRKPID